MKQQSSAPTQAQAPSRPPEPAWTDRAPADHPRRRRTDTPRTNPFQRLAHQVLALGLCLPFVLWQLSGQTGLWQANAFAYDQFLAARERAPDAPRAGGVVQVWLDEPCAPQGCAVLSMRYREALRLLADQRPAAIWIEASALSGAEREDLRRWLRIHTGPRQPPVRLLHGDWLRPDRDGIVRGLDAGTDHPLRLALDGSASGAPDAWLGWAWTPAPTPLAFDGIDYAGLLLGLHPASALQGRPVVLGARFPSATGGPWLVRSGAASHVLSRTDALAQAVSALQQQRVVRAAGPLALWWWSALPLWLLMLLAWRWPEALAAWVLILSAGVLGLSWLALDLKGWWWPAATPIAGLLLFQLGWTWLRGWTLARVFGQRIERAEQILAEGLDTPAPPSQRPAQAPPRRHLSRMEALDQTLARLEAQHQVRRRMQRQRDRWLSFLSHDLRAPQSNILNLLDLRQNGVEGMDDTRFYGGIRQQVERTLHLAEGFVDLLRAESDQLNLQPCHLAALAAEAVDRCWPQAHARQVHIEQRGAPEDAGPIVMADPELLTRALHNILNNAVRHCATGRQVTLCVAHDTDGGQAQCLIRDEGEGMDEGQLSRLLMALDCQTWRWPKAAPSPGQRQGHGLGLGLQVTRTVVTRHGGELDAWSAPDQGCSFAIALPAAPHAASHGGAAALSSENPPAATRALPA